MFAAKVFKAVLGFLYRRGQARQEIHFPAPAATSDVAGAAEASLSAPNDQAVASGGKPLTPAASPETGAVPGVAVQHKAAKPARGNMLSGDVEANQIEVAANIALTGEIRGRGNIVRIGDTRNLQKVHLIIHGNGNVVTIGRRSLLQSLRIEIGSKRWCSSRSRLTIGENFSIGSRGRFLLPNSGNVVEIGDNCMFSNSVQLRGGEYPHLIFDKETGANLDLSDGIFIGNHVWVGEGAFLGKSVSIPDDCIVGARSVVTKRFDQSNAVIAGNPARLVKSGVQWVANEFVLQADHPDLLDEFSDSQLNRINLAERENGVAAVEIVYDPV